MCMKNPEKFSSMGYEFLEFFNGNQMPKIGLGTWNMSNEEAEKCVEVALEAGYRHIDTAALYGNEEGIGKAIKRWLTKGSNKRDDLFITTKLPISHNRRSDVSLALKRSLQLLQLDFVDLYLIHCPVGCQNIEGQGPVPFNEDGTLMLDMKTDLVEIWKGMEEEVENNRTKAIGLSNFNIQQIQKILDCCKIRPANLQVELHARFRQLELKKFCDLNAISMVSYGTLGSRGRIALGIVESNDEAIKLLEDETVLRIAKKHGKTPAQILLRQLTLLNIGVIPKSVNPERIRLNFKIFDFCLDDVDMKELDKLDLGTNGRSFSMKSLKGLETHPEYPFEK